MGLLSKLSGRATEVQPRPEASGTGSNATRPNLILAGAPRSGTSSLRYYLMEHPDIAMLVGKDFEPVGGEDVGLPFNSPFVAHSHRAGALEAYDACCERVRGRHPYIGVSVRYAIYYPHLMHNIRHHLPDARLLFILRNPIDRARSSYTYTPPEKRDKTFDEMIRIEQHEAEEAAKFSNRGQWKNLFKPGGETNSIIERGLYAPCLRRILDIFPREQVHVIRFEAFKRDPNAELTRVLDWLGLRPHTFARTDEVKGQSTDTDVISPQTRAMLSDYYAEFNQQLWDLLGWDGQPWS
ncbi:MAG: sulfotransferase [Phycisphaeraceae bacterium]|nr:sulfotransferase [Phycisphaeraceae bacterium]MCW5763203.1 sulfotransferase [Phycisphaeraceae bacterium]